MKILKKTDEEIWIELPCGKKTVISAEDSWIIKEFPVWGIAGSHSKYVFAERSIDSGYSMVRERIYLHRLILKEKNRKVNVDHKDRDRLNNRRSNLRICSARQNMANTAAKNGKRFKGVFLDKRCGHLKKRHASYISYIEARLGGLVKRKYLGRFFTAEEAAAAYNKASKEIYGEFAFQNEGV